MNKRYQLKKQILYKITHLLKGTLLNIRKVTQILYQLLEFIQSVADISHLFELVDLLSTKKVGFVLNLKLGCA